MIFAPVISNDVKMSRAKINKTEIMPVFKVAR